MLTTLKKWIYRFRPYRAKFEAYYTGPGWNCSESKSGPGSTLDATRAVREALPGIIAANKIRSIVDVPCGDFNWMRRVDLKGIDYRGLDIVPQLINDNTTRFGNSGVHFELWDLMRTPPPKADLLICRDLLFHYTNKMAVKGLSNLRASGASFLLTTTFTKVDINKELFAIGWFRPINLQLPPFNMPPPLELIMEEPERGKAMGLWRIAGSDA